MEILITGCERSGTKMLSKILGDKCGVDFNLENKHTIACFKYYEEIPHNICLILVAADSLPVFFGPRFSAVLFREKQSPVHQF